MPGTSRPPKRRFPSPETPAPELPDGVDRKPAVCPAGQGAACFAPTVCRVIATGTIGDPTKCIKGQTVGAKRKNFRLGTVG